MEIKSKDTKAPFKPPTLREQQKATRFEPDILVALIIACNKYGNVCRDKNGEITQWMPDLDVMPDVEQFEDIARALGMTDD